MEQHARLELGIALYFNASSGAAAPGSAAEGRGVPVKDQRPAAAMCAARASRVRRRPVRRGQRERAAPRNRRRWRGPGRPARRVPLRAGSAGVAGAPGDRRRIAPHSQAGAGASKHASRFIRPSKADSGQVPACPSCNPGAVSCWPRGCLPYLYPCDRQTALRFVCSLCLLLTLTSVGAAISIPGVGSFTF